MEKPRKVRTTKQWKEYLDDLVRKYFKLHYGTEPVCVCCKKKIGWYSWKYNPKGMQVGHYQDRTMTIIRWDLRNVHPQCSGCNYEHKFGRTLPYTNYIIETYGADMIQILLELYKNNRVIKGTQFYEDTEKDLLMLIAKESYEE